MAKLLFSAKGFDAVKRTRYERDALNEVFGLAIEAINKQEPIPMPIGDFLVSAFQAFINAPDDKKEQALLHALRWRSSNRRQEGDPWVIGGFVAMNMEFGKLDDEGNEIEPPLGLTASYKAAAEHFRISVSSARNKYEAYLKLQADADRLREEEDWS